MSGDRIVAFLRNIAALHLSRRAALHFGASAVLPMGSRGRGAPQDATPATGDATSATPEAVLHFPAGFLWGTASSAESNEGAVTADGRGPSIWDTFSHTPGKTVNGDTGDVACEEYYRYASAFDLMADLQYRAYRFSVSWSRIFPTGSGAVNQAGLDHYQRVVDALLSRGISPFVTIYHWDLPHALQDTGGWTNRDTAERYADFGATVYRALGDRVPHFLCLNEPNSQALLGYGVGAIAPGVADPAAVFPATHHQLLGQGLAVQAMRAHHRPGAQIGTTLNLEQVVPASGGDADLAAATLFDGVWNRTYLDPIFKGSYPADILAYYEKVSSLETVRPGDLAIIASPLDFLGVNYYTTAVNEADPHPPGYRIVPPSPASSAAAGFGANSSNITAMGWAVAPGGMTAILRRVHDEYTRLPIYVTETGVAYDDYVDPAGQVKDPERIAFLDAYFRAVHAAIAQGVDVRGLTVWCFQDNFASTNGYSKKFGLVWTDFVTQRRTPKQSAYWYRDIIARNGLAAPPALLSPAELVGEVEEP